MEDTYAGILSGPAWTRGSSVARRAELRPLQTQGQLWRKDARPEAIPAL